MAALLIGSEPAVGAEPVVSPNPLERPMADLAILASPDPSATPMLLVLEAESPSRKVARLAMLRRDAAWNAAASAEIDLGAEDLTARWLVRLDEGRFALIATTPQSAPGTGRAVVVSLAVDAQARAARIEELNRQEFDRAIEDSGAADVDGFGSPELLLGMRPSVSLESCGTSTLVVVDGSIAAVRRSIEIPGPRGAGVLGRFDDVPGSDLLMHSSAGCPPGGDFQTSLRVIRLADGTQSRPMGGVRRDFVTSLPPPLVLDVDGSAPDEVLATGEAGLMVFDPSRAWRATLVADGSSVPLVAGPTGRPDVPGVRVAILDANGARLVTGRLERRKEGIVWTGRSDLAGETMVSLRWSILSGAIEAAGTHQMVPNAWIGDPFATGCPDIVIPGAILPCGRNDPRPGPAWLATRPVAAIPIGDRRAVLAAVGLEWTIESGLPASPTPAAAGPIGWWRHGPSAPFALAELRPEALADVDAVPRPAATTIETTAAADGIARLSGSPGTRFFAAIVPMAVGDEPGLPSTDALLALRTRPESGGSRSVVRLPMPEGDEPGRAESFASLDVGHLRVPGDQTAYGWSIRVVPVNDLGEWGQPTTGSMIHDDAPPTLTLEEPFTSAIWPSLTNLVGRSDPGSTVRVDGVGEVDVDESGGFTIRTQLAPWPQPFRVTATDPAGNQTVASFSVVGGVDYRRFPWPGILTVALLALVTWRGLFGGRRARANGAWVMRPTMSPQDDDAQLPVIEELPPGNGLVRR